MRGTWICVVLSLHQAIGAQDANGIVHDVFQQFVEQGMPHLPPPLTPEARQQVLAALPSEGEIEPDTRDRVKLDSVTPILAAHNSETRIAIKVVRIPFACIALYARTVVVISAPALKNVSADELQAMIAHELGHEPFLDEYYRAKAYGNSPALKRLELLADAFAIATLIKLGKDPHHLMSATVRINRFNANLGLTPVNASNYPSDNERRMLHEMIAEWLATSSEAFTLKK